MVTNNPTWSSQYTLGTPVRLAVSGAAADSGALTAGWHLLSATIDLCYRINPGAAGTAAVWDTDPCLMLLAGAERLVYITTGQAINAITAGGSGKLIRTPVA